MQIVFLVKGPIYLACISCTDEPVEALKGQLELLYGQVKDLIQLTWFICLQKSWFFVCIIFILWMWLQVLLILTKSVNRCFEKNPKFDMAPLLGGTDAVFSSLIHSFSWFVTVNLF